MVTRRPADEIARLGDAIYERDIRREVEAEHHGAVVAIDVESGTWAMVLSELRTRMTRSEAPSLLPCLRRRHFGDQCMPEPDEASSLLGQGDDLAAATASAQVLAELLKRRAEACR